MKGKWTISGIILAVLLLALAAGLTQAQGPEPPGGVGIQAALGTAFTYQGQLKKDGNPVNENCDFRFQLRDSVGTIVGQAEKTNVEVRNGLFTIPDLDFLSGAFNGEAREMAIGVRCPAGSGSDYTWLTPRQKITPAPYALALPGLWTQQHDTSPNVIGGYSRNSVTSGVAGATIGGGGASVFPHRVTDHYSTVGGGAGNQAGDNDESPNDATCATVSGGARNTAIDQYATVGGGNFNTASGYAATVGGGQYNTASDYNATVGGGSDNTASAYNATVPGGFRAAATHYGEMAYASGYFAANGDAQTSVYVLRRVSSGTTLTELFLDGSGQRLTIASGRTVTFDILIVGREDSNGESAGYWAYGVIERVGADTAIVGWAQVLTLGEDDSSWSVTVDADDTNDALRIQVQSGTGDTVRWVATVRTAEVSW